MKRPKMSLPEAVDGFGWTHRATPNSGSVDLVARIFSAPIDDTPTARFIRLHELAHARWTPRTGAARAANKAGVSLDALQVCEDARIQLKLREETTIARSALCGALTSSALAEAVKRAVEFNQQRHIIMLAVACIATHNADELNALQIAAAPDSPAARILSTATTAARKVADVLHQRLPRTRGTLTFKHTLEAARLLDSILGLADAREEAETLPPPLDGSVESSEGDGTTAEPGTGIKNARPGRKEASESGEMTIERLPCTVPTDALRLGRIRRANDTGSVPRNIHRLPTDGRIFDTKRRAAGGTVLFDASGSMKIDAEQITEMLETAPAAVVAMYSGSGDKGVLSIIAERGKVATADAIQAQRVRAGGGNIIDEPALAWLAKQPEPRLWVCDGIVTGKKDRAADDVLGNRIRTVAIRGNIRRAETLSDAVKSLKGKGRR